MIIEILFQKIIEAFNLMKATVIFILWLFILWLFIFIFVTIADMLLKDMFGLEPYKKEKKDGRRRK